MKRDSTLSYADKEGFSCGVCYEYSVFNFLTRQKLDLKEKPLIIMEGSFLTYQKDLKMLEIEHKISNLKNIMVTLYFFGTIVHLISIQKLYMNEG